MAQQFLPLPIAGQPIPFRQLTIPKAREAASALRSGVMNWVELVECQQHYRQAGAADEVFAESIIFDVEVETPQRPVHDIRRRERIAVTFSFDERTYPEVHALRPDFPRVMHRNLTRYELPLSLCLFDEPYSEIKLRWTAHEFIERVRNWLAETAAGVLHKADQPMEPLLIGADGTIVLPAEVFSAARGFTESLRVFRADNDGGPLFLIASKTDEDLLPNQKPRSSIAIPIIGQPQPHGIIHRQPANLAELHDFLRVAQLDLLSLLRDRLRALHHENGDLEAELILLLILPKTRQVSGEVEEKAVEFRVFFCAERKDGDFFFTSIKRIGERIGVWALYDNQIGTLLTLDTTKRGEEIELRMLNPCSNFSRELAAACNGLTERAETRIAVVGLGALGSQVFLNLLRAGYGEWTLIDNDHSLPHNAARHALYGGITGLPKAGVLANVANATIGGPPIATALVADVLDPGEQGERVTNSLQQAEVILDCSASIAVARHLAHEVDSLARRVSLFLNPAGDDLVLLAEDIAREYPLDSLEMQYYRWLVSEPEFRGHLRSSDGRVRHGHTCRDVSSVIPQDRVALCAAIGSLALKQALKSDTSMIAMWRSDQHGGVKSFVLTPAPVWREQVGEWRIYVDEALLEKLRHLRTARLPVETGGVLLGFFDMPRKRIYVADALPAPPDSAEEIDGYVRGVSGLQARLAEIEEITAGNLGYVGEWHSHPDGCKTSMSSEDLELLIWLSRRLAVGGRPSLMLIVGEQTHSWNMGTLVDEGVYGIR